MVHTNDLRLASEIGAFTFHDVAKSCHLGRGSFGERECEQVLFQICQAFPFEVIR